MNRPPAFIEPFLAPAAFLYRSATLVRNFLFENGVRRIESVGTPVLSIGNLTSGGTGKTPLVALLVEGFRRRGVDVGIVSRGYRSVENGPSRVPTEGVGVAARFGDEPAWLAARYPEVPVVICADRVAAARALVGEKKVRLIIADDAFQHRRLGRGFDAVVMDASEPRWHYRPLPMGRMREPFAALSRAHAVFLTKVNLASADSTSWLRSQIEGARLQVFELESRIQGFAPLTSMPSSPATESAADFRGRKIFLVSGIGNPSAFRWQMENEIGVSLAGHAIFRDHHSYSSDDLHMIERNAAESGAAYIVTTEKDAVKLGGWTSRCPVWVTRLATEPRTDLKGFYEAIDRILI